MKNLNVPNLRFPEFTGEWTRCTIGDYGNVITGSTPSTNDAENYDNGTYLWASPADLGGTKYIELTQTRLTDKGFAKTRCFPANSILVTCIGSTIGKMGMSKIAMSTNQQINTIVPTGHDANFVYYALQSRFPRYLSSIAVQAVPIISKSAFEKLENHTTQIDEQEKISSFLSLLDNRIETQNKIIQQLQSLIKGICSFLFDKNKFVSFVRLGDISEITNGNSDVQDASLSYSKGMYPFFDRSNDVKFLPEYILDKESIIYPGEGSEFYPRYYNGKFALHQRCYAIYDISHNFKPKYLYYFCKTQNSYFVRNAVGSTVASLRLDTFKRLNIPHVPIEVQETYVQLLDKIETKIIDNKAILKKYEEQKKYLLSNLFI